MDGEIAGARVLANAETLFVPLSSGKDLIGLGGSWYFGLACRVIPNFLCNRDGESEAVKLLSPLLGGGGRLGSVRGFFIVGLRVEGGVADV